MANQWDGVCKTETDLKFWADAYLVMARIHIDSSLREDALKRRLDLVADTTDHMLRHFQTARMLLEDYQARG